jgi:iron complex outermembrane receptor protein
MSQASIRRYALLKAALLMGTVLAATPAFAQSEGSAQLEEIVVTAQKREQNLQEVPISVTAVTAESLKANRIVDLRDLSALAPNFTVRVSPGGSASATFSMRGLVTAGNALGSDKGISQYLDGVYLQNTAGSIFELADIERIEVLKGPQGTLFGRNATGGAISFTTRNPAGEFRVHQELTLGNYDHARSKTRVDLPQVGPFSAAVTYTHSRRDGDTRNLGAGAIWDWSSGGQGLRLSPKRLGDNRVDAIFAAVKLDLTPDLDIVYKFDWTENHFTPEARGVAYVDSRVLPAILASQPNQALMTPITTRRPDAVNNGFTSRSLAFASGHNLTVQYAVNDEISVKNVLSSRRSGSNATYELASFGGLRVTPAMVTLGLAPAALVGAPWELLANNAKQLDRQWSNETQLNWNHRWFALTAGYIHFDYKVTGGGFPGAPNTLSFRPLPGFVLPAINYRLTSVHTKSDALYAQFEGHVTSRLDIVGGYRITRDRKSGVDNTVQAASGSVTRPLSYEKTRPTYLIGVNYKPTDDIFLYAKYATGFISGGQLAGATYQPETAESYEAGIKADFFDRRFRSNLAVFDVKYGQLQFQTSGMNIMPPVNASVVLINAGDAKAKGFEWENTILPMRGLTLTANVGYTDFKYTRIGPVIGNLATFLPTSRPDWTASGSVQYQTEEVLAGGHMVFRLDANYRGKTYNGYSLTGNQAAVDATTVKSSWLVNGRVALVDFDIAGARAEAAIWGKNLLDNDKMISGGAFFLGAFGASYSATFERARTFGVDLILDF